MIPNQEYPVYFSNPSTQYLKGKDSQVVLINLIFEVSAKMNLQPLFFMAGSGVYHFNNNGVFLKELNK